MEGKAVRDLLEKVNFTNRKYDEIAEITGERFNIFNILKVERSEVHTHSAILGELLDVNGSHGQKDVFLNLFIEYLINEKKIKPPFDNFDSKKSKTTIEKHIGLIDEKKERGGRIDIIIEANKSAIIIENKIDACDQEKQLLRYYNYGKSNFQGNFLLIYLTKDGKRPESNTTGINDDVKNKTISISYEKHIIEWLEICKKEASSLPILRETISQYINLIKKLTNQTINHKMSEDITSLLSLSAGNFRAAEAISKETQNARKKIVNHLWKEVFRQICEHLGRGWLIKDLGNWGKMLFKEDCEIFGYCFDRICEDKTYLGIITLCDKDFTNQDERQKAYFNVFREKANYHGYEDYNNLWIDRSPVSSYGYIFNEAVLESLLPLNDSISKNPAVLNLVEEFKQYENKKNNLYVDEMSQMLKADFEFVKILKGKILELGSFKADIYQKFVLYFNLRILDKFELAIDVFVTDGECVIEVFIRNQEREMNDEILLRLDMFSEGINRTNRHGFIYKRYKNLNVDEISFDLQSLITNLSTIDFKI